MQQREPGTVSVGTAVVVMVIVGALIAFWPTRPRTAEPASDALTAAEHQVSLQLLNPPSASFPAELQAVSELSPGEYRINGRVYSTNVYGAVVPAGYECILLFHDGSPAAVTALRVDDQQVVEPH